MPLRGLSASVAGAALLGTLMAPIPALAVVNTAPTANTDVISIDEDTGPATGNVLANDTDPDGDTLTVLSVWPLDSGKGTLTVAANGAYEYNPPANWFGATLTWYYVSDGNGHTELGYINITVASVNDAPVAADHAISTNEDTAVDQTAAQLKSGATDVEGNPISVTGVSGATHGGVAWDGAKATFTPAAGYCGTAGFDYSIEDSLHAADTAHVTVDVTCVNDVPVAVPDAASGTEDQDVVITGADLVANDTDADGDTLSVGGVDDPVHGSVGLAAGTVTFTPAADYCGAASFTYQATDGTAGSNWATVSLTLACVNDAPVANPDSGTVAEASGAAMYDVLDNDTDAEGDTLSITDVHVDAAAGTASIVGGEVRFAPAAAFKGSAVVTYTVSDGKLTDIGTLTVLVETDLVAPVPVAPTVAFGTGRVDESAPLLVSWSATDAGVGVATYTVEVSVGGAGWTQVYTGPAKSVTKLYPFGKSLVWRVRATDKESNTSGWATSTTRSLTAYQGGAPMTYTGTWSTMASAGSSGTGYRYTTGFGNRAILSYTGLGVLYVAPKTATAGYARVSIDGGAAVRVNLHASSASLGVIVTSKMYAASGAHTIRIWNDQAGRRTTFDTFVVLR